MWSIFRAFSRNGAALRSTSASWKFRSSLVAFSSASLFIGGSVVLNDHSSKSLDGISVDSSIDPFPTTKKSADSKIFSEDYKLVATGVRSVTFVSFKVYGVGLYIPENSDATVISLVSEFLKKHPSATPQSLLNDKTISEELIAQLSEKVPYALKITPVRNTDFGHLRDGLTKSILANPLAKTVREEVAAGVEQLRGLFQGFKGSVPKNDTLWVLSNTRQTTIMYEGRTVKTLGQVSEPWIAKVLLVSYLSSAKPLSEPLRQSFVSYIAGKFQ